VQRTVAGCIDKNLWSVRKESIADPVGAKEVRAHVGGLNLIRDKALGASGVHVGVVGRKCSGLVELVNQGGEFFAGHVEGVGDRCPRGLQFY
jgi:hypothetical protein